MSVVDKVEKYTFGPDRKDFTKDEQKLIDIDGLQRNYLKITFKKLDDKVYFTLRDITRSQYALPVKYLKPVPNSYSYVAQKSQIYGKERDIRNAGITIEPLNPDIFNLITYTPINQSLPIGTVVTIDVEVPYEIPNSEEEPERKFIWSSNLQTEDKIEEKIKAANPSSIHTKPWIEKCHYCAIDIGSRVSAKYEVQMVDTDIVKSFSLFGFARCDEEKVFVIWTYACFNVLPIDILKAMMKMDEQYVVNDSKQIIDEIIGKSK